MRMRTMRHDESRTAKTIHATSVHCAAEPAALAHTRLFMPSMRSRISCATDIAVREPENPDIFAAFSIALRARLQRIRGENAVNHAIARALAAVAYELLTMKPSPRAKTV
jgi:hypothetical protein